MRLDLPWEGEGAGREGPGSLQPPERGHLGIVEKRGLSSGPEAMNFWPFAKWSSESWESLFLPLNDQQTSCQGLFGNRERPAAEEKQNLGSASRLCDPPQERAGCWPSVQNGGCRHAFPPQAQGLPLRWSGGGPLVHPCLLSCV